MSEVSASHISNLIRGLNKQPPTLRVLEKLVNLSNEVTYFDFMHAAGHINLSEENIEGKSEKLRLELQLYHQEKTHSHNLFSKLINRADNNEVSKLNDIIESLENEKISNLIALLSNKQRIKKYSSNKYAIIK